jgi:hypothetical protein
MQGDLGWNGCPSLDRFTEGRSEFHQLGELLLGCVAPNPVSVKDRTSQCGSDSFATPILAQQEGGLLNAAHMDMGMHSVAHLKVNIAVKTPQFRSCPRHLMPFQSSHFQGPDQFCCMPVSHIHRIMYCHNDMPLGKPVLQFKNEV